MAPKAPLFELDSDVPFFCFGLEIPFLGKFGQKVKIFYLR